MPRMQRCERRKTRTRKKFAHKGRGGGAETEMRARVEQDKEKALGRTSVVRAASFLCAEGGHLF